MEERYYYLEDGEWKRAKNNTNALWLAAQGVEMHTKEEAQRLYLEKHPPKAEVKPEPVAEVKAEAKEEAEVKEEAEAPKPKKTFKKKK